MTSTAIVNRQTRRSNITAEAAFPDLVTLGFVRVLPGTVEGPARERRRRTAKTTRTTLDEMPGVLRPQPVDNNLLAQLREMNRRLRDQRLQSMAQSSRRIRVKSAPAGAPLQMIMLHTTFVNVKRRFFLQQSPWGCRELPRLCPPRADRCMVKAT